MLKIFGNNEKITEQKKTQKTCASSTHRIDTTTFALVIYACLIPWIPVKKNTNPAKDKTANIFKKCSDDTDDTMLFN